MNVAVIGLGKLGLPLAALMASVGHKVAAFDASEHSRNELRAGRCPIQEPRLNDLLTKSKANLNVVDTVGEAVSLSDVAFVIVPTPSLPSGHFSNAILLNVLEGIGESLKVNKKTYTVDIVSTVMPGSCEGELGAALERTSGQKIGSELGLCYNPEFIALGSVIRDMQYPDMQLLGASSDFHADRVEQVLKSITLKESPVRRMNLPEAELAKISVNNFVTTKIAFANMLFQAAEKLGAVNVDTVTEAIGLDSRIGGKYLKGGAPFGGPCFPRDTRALSALLKDLSVDGSIPGTVELANNSHTDYLAERVIAEASANDVVGIAGVSYKPFTHVLDESPSLLLSSRLLEAGRSVICWDPNPQVAQGMPDWVQYESDFDTFVERTNFVVIARHLPEMDSAKLEGAFSGKATLDIWRQFTKKV